MTPKEIIILREKNFDEKFPDPIFGVKSFGVEDYKFIEDDIKSHIEETNRLIEEATRREIMEEESAFLSNVLNGIDLADEQMGNKGGGTKAIRVALQARGYVLQEITKK